MPKDSIKIQNHDEIKNGKKERVKFQKKWLDLMHQTNKELLLNQRISDELEDKKQQLLLVHYKIFQKHIMDE